MKPILEINNISKKFRINHELQPYLSLRDKLTHLFRKHTSTEDFWALKDVSFNVMPGDTIGIIGKNGAGKSTLLKILSRITPPTNGKITCRGRIASLLEVGTGFHPELDGRENVFLNGSILGMKRAEIKKQFDAIVDFAGVEKFIDTPLKHYSSGMQLRLAFAVAAFLENEILIIDEVLAVGDSEFQKKCMGKMDEVSKSGRTILFVSHDLTAIANLTKKTIFLNQGNIISFSDTNKIIEQYIDYGSIAEKKYRKSASTTNNQPQITMVDISTSLPNNIHEHGKSMGLKIQFFNNQIPNKSLWLSVHITDTRKKGVLHLTNGGAQFLICNKPGYSELTIDFPSLKLYMGKYLIDLYLSGPPNAEVYERLHEIISFEVIMIGSNHEFGWIPNVCTYIEDVNWRINNV